VIEQRELINILAPALRGLRAEGQALPLVRFDPARAADAPVFEPGKADDARALVGELRQWLAQRPQPNAVSVPQLGTFHISPAPVGGRVGGKIALVTGGAQGFGLEIASALAREGACVVLGDVTCAERKRPLQGCANGTVKTGPWAW